MPRIEYKLSFENYLEMSISRPGKAKYRSAAISALAGFSLMAVGYTYLQIWPDTRTIIGGIFLATGLLATGLALVLAFLEKPKPVRPDVTILRREYERFHSDSRALEFDENGWRVFWYEGQDVRPWSRVRAIYNQQSLFVLSTETTHYWFPKAALEKDGQLDNLRKFAHGALTRRDSLFTVSMRPSAVAYVEAMFLHSWRSSFKRNILVYLGVILVFYWLLFGGWNSDPPFSPWLLGFAPVLFTVFECLHYLRLYLFADWPNASREVEIMSDCVHYKTERIDWIAKYSRLEKWRESPSAFLLYFEPTAFHLIPKKDFSKDQIIQFRSLLSSSA
jgi:hypothetical protein